MDLNPLRNYIKNSENPVDSVRDMDYKIDIDVLTEKGKAAIFFEKSEQVGEAFQTYLIHLESWNQL